MRDWIEPFSAFVPQTRAMVRKYHWALPFMELDDLLQESWVVYDRVSRKYRESALEMADGDPERARRVFAGAYRRALSNRLQNMVRDANAPRRRGQTHAVPTSVLLDDSWEAPEDRNRTPDCMRAVEIAIDLGKAPSIVRILDHKSWDLHRCRELPGTDKDGVPRTRDDMLRSIAGRRTKGDVCAQLRRVV